MRFVIVGAGAVGDGIGAGLFSRGTEVLFVARGRNLDALQRGGLRLQAVGGDRALDVDVVGAPGEINFRDDDIILLATKTQDADLALTDLITAGVEDLPIFCAQNGVESERMALRRFSRVFGVLVLVRIEHLNPGVVRIFQHPPGILDVGGAVSGGTDPIAEEVATSLRDAGFRSRTRRDIMAWKRAKLLRNLVNALEVIYDSVDAPPAWIAEQAHGEAMRCLTAAGLAVVDDATWDRRCAVLSPEVPLEGGPRRGGSTLQSILRGSRRIEIDYLNGAIVLLGRTHGIPTPVNQALQLIVNRVASGRLSRSAASGALNDLLRAGQIPRRP